MASTVARHHTHPIRLVASPYKRAPATHLRLHVEDVLELELKGGGHGLHRLEEGLRLLRPRRQTPAPPVMPIGG